MRAALAPYNVSLAAFSPLFHYTPSRDGDVSTTWNASYTGRDVWPALVDTVRPAGVAYRRTQFDGATVALSFEGQGLYFCFTANNATFTLTLDDNPVGQTSSQFVSANNDAGPCKDSGAESMFAAPALQMGTHSMLLTVSAASDHEFRFFGGAITLGVNTKGHEVRDSNVVDDQDGAWAVAGGRSAANGTWDTLHHPSLFDTTGTFQCNYGHGTTASYKFAGAGGVVLRGYVWRDAHSFSVSLDGATVNLDAASSWEDGGAVFFARGNLDPAVIHTITVEDYSSDDDGCARGSDGGYRFCCVCIDALVLLEAGPKTLDVPSPPSNTGTPETAEPSESTSSSKSIAGPVAGGVVGGLALVGVVLFALLYYRRRKKRRSVVLAPTSADNSHFVAQPLVGDTDYGMRYAGQRGAILSSSDVYASPSSAMASEAGPFGLPPREKQTPINQASPAAETRSGYAAADSAVASGMAPADLERVLAFVAQRIDQQRPESAAATRLDEHPPEYRG